MSADILYIQPLVGNSRKSNGGQLRLREVHVADQCGGNEREAIHAPSAYCIEDYCGAYQPFLHARKGLPNVVSSESSGQLTGARTDMTALPRGALIKDA